MTDDEARARVMSKITGGKVDPHVHDLPHLFLRRANRKVYACYCGSLFVVSYACAGGDCVKVWHHIGEVVRL